MASLRDSADLYDLCPVALPHRENAWLILLNVTGQSRRIPHDSVCLCIPDIQIKDSSSLHVFAQTFRWYGREREKEREREKTTTLGFLFCV